VRVFIANQTPPGQPDGLLMQETLFLVNNCSIGPVPQLGGEGWLYFVVCQLVGIGMVMRFVMKSDWCGAHSNDVKGAIQKCMHYSHYFHYCSSLIHTSQIMKIMKKLEYENDRIMINNEENKE
jgi:hypothetical protein